MACMDGYWMWMPGTHPECSTYNAVLGSSLYSICCDANVCSSTGLLQTECLSYIYWIDLSLNYSKAGHKTEISTRKYKGQEWTKHGYRDLCHGLRPLYSRCLGLMLRHSLTSTVMMVDSRYKGLWFKSLTFTPLNKSMPAAADFPLSSFKI